MVADGEQKRKWEQKRKLKRARQRQPADTLSALFWRYESARPYAKRRDTHELVDILALCCEQMDIRTAGRRGGKVNPKSPKLASFLRRYGPSDWEIYLALEPLAKDHQTGEAEEPWMRVGSGRSD